MTTAMANDNDITNFWRGIHVQTNAERGTRKGGHWTLLRFGHPKQPRARMSVWRNKMAIKHGREAGAAIDTAPASAPPVRTMVCVEAKTAGSKAMVVGATASATAARSNLP